jgi:uncharacterized membrane protein YkvA (DUF1232 family)
MARVNFIKSARRIGTLSALWHYRSGLFGMFRDICRGRYRASFLTVVAVVAAVIYILSPIDLIPDFIPVIGWLDDGAVLYFLLKRLMYELSRYNASRANLKLVKR